MHIYIYWSPAFTCTMRNYKFKWTLFVCIVARSGTKSTTKMTSDQEMDYVVLTKKAGVEPQMFEAGPDYIGSSQLPCHSDIHVSYLNGQRIQVHTCTCTSDSFLFKHS